MMNFFNDVLFDLLMFAKSLPAFLITIIVLYFVIKFAVKKGLQEYQDALEKKNKNNDQTIETRNLSGEFAYDSINKTI